MIKIFELFAGIGAPRKALTNLGIDYTSLGYSEIDNNAVKAYCQIHDDDVSNNYGDISNIKELPADIDLLFHGSPCQDFSKAGLSSGGEINSGTRSSLMWETVRLISQSKPRIVIWENVRTAISGKHKSNFEKYLETLSELGYTNSYRVLNAKYFGVPQNRERVFVVSILNGESFDFDSLTTVDTPNLTDFVDFETNDNLDLNIPVNTKSGVATLTTPGVVNLGFPTSKTRRGRVIDGGSVTPTLQTSHEFYAISKKFGEFVETDSKTSKLGYFGKDYLDKRVYDVTNPAISLVTSNNPFYTDYINIRKLNSNECFRLMGFSDEDYYRISNDFSESALIKMAGNSIVVPLLEELFDKLFK